MKLLKYTMVLASCGAAVLSAQAQNLVNNGSFETGSLADWALNPSGNVGVSSVEGAADGTDAAVFNGSNGNVDGVLSQSLSTVAGSHYTLTFDYGTYGSPGVEGQTLDVDVSGTSSLLQETAVSPTGGLDTPFGAFTFSFIADSSSTELTFTDDPGNSTHASYNDGVLDNVSVVDPPAVPDGGSTVMLGGMSLAALAWFRRKLAQV